MDDFLEQSITESMKANDVNEASNKNKQIAEDLNDV